jgi:tetratricopeptide (TPR) repeat protein
MALGRFAEAIPHLEMAAKLQSEPGCNFPKLPDVLPNLQEAYARTGNLYSAIYAADLVEKQKLRLPVKNQLFQAAIYRFLGLPDLEKQTENQTVRAIQSSGTPASQQTMGEVVRSVDGLAKQLKLTEAVETTASRVRRDGDANEAARLYDLALAVAKKKNDKNEIAMVLFNKAGALDVANQITRAIDCWKDLIAFQEAEPDKFKDQIWLSYAGLGQTYSKAKQHEMAVAQFRKAFETRHLALDLIERPFLMSYSSSLKALGKGQEAKELDDQIAKIPEIPGINK